MIHTARNSLRRSSMLPLWIVNKAAAIWLMALAKQCILLQCPKKVQQDCTDYSVTHSRECFNDSRVCTVPWLTVEMGHKVTCSFIRTIVFKNHAAWQQQFYIIPNRYFTKFLPSWKFKKELSWTLYHSFLKVILFDPG